MWSLIREGSSTKELGLLYMSCLYCNNLLDRSTQSIRIRSPAGYKFCAITAYDQRASQWVDRQAARAAAAAAAAVVVIVVVIMAGVVCGRGSVH